MADFDELRAIRNLVSQAHLILTAPKMPEGGVERAADLLETAISQADTLLASSTATFVGRRGDVKKS